MESQQTADKKGDCKHKNKEIAFYTYVYISYYCPDCDESFKSYDKKRITELIKKEGRR